MANAEGTPPEPEQGGPEQGSTEQGGTERDATAQDNALSVLNPPIALVLRAYSTEYAIYGTVLVSALIAVGWKYDTNLEVFQFVVGTIGVFWLAHIYSGVIATEQTDGPRAKALWRAAIHTASQTVGMVVAMLVPAVFLLLATVGILDEYVAYYLALWVGVALLAVLGWVNAARRGNHWAMRLLSAAITSALGLGVIWLSSLVH